MLEGQQGKVELILMKMALLSLKVLECQMTLKKIKSHGEMAGMHQCCQVGYGVVNSGGTKSEIKWMCFKKTPKNGAFGHIMFTLWVLFRSTFTFFIESSEFCTQS